MANIKKPKPAIDFSKFKPTISANVLAGRKLKKTSTAKYVSPNAGRKPKGGM